MYINWPIQYKIFDRIEIPLFESQILQEMQRSISLSGKNLFT